MALFSRRTLQRILDENSTFLSRHQSLTICDILNKPGKGYLAKEWEQAILNAADKVGSVQHEGLVGKRRPDLIFNSANPSLEFIADVTAASDQGYEDSNPVEAFEEEFHRRLARENLLTGGFDFRIDANPGQIYRGSKEKVRLKLPEDLANWGHKIFNKDFVAFLRSVKEQPERQHQFNAVSEDTGVHIAYKPDKRGFSSGGYMVFTIAPHITKNVVYNALKAKGDKIKDANYEGIAGIFLCDAGCDLLSADRPTWSSYKADDIIWRFLKDFDSIWFVAVFTVREVQSQVRHQARLFINPKKKIDALSLEQVLDGILKAMPAPETTPFQARYALKSGRGLTGRYLSGMKINLDVEMSARELLEILSGTRTIEEFERSYSFSRAANPFARRLAEGRLISKVTIQHVAEHDDDRVKIEFGEPDPAVSPLRAIPSRPV